MFATKTRSAQPQSRRLNLESLESRQMMIATHLVLDFTPDYRNGNFVQTFQNTRTASGQSPAFLDFNGDRRITTQDAEIAAGQIRNTMAGFFAGPARGYNVSVVYGDILSQTNFGYRWLQQGTNSANDQVLVMYFGGRDVGEIGRAPVARDGYNVEGYGNTYTQEIANMLLSRPGATKDMFVWAVANTAAHELGHMLGLRHSQGGYSNDVMNATQSLTPWKDVFSSVNQRTEGGAVQNAVAELQRSFYGQPTFFQGSNNGSAQMGAEAGFKSGTGHDHELDDDDCGLDLESILAGFDANFAAETAIEPTASNADALATLLAAETTFHTATTAPASNVVKNSAPVSTKSDLLTILAVELAGSSHSNSAAPAAAKPAALKQLDELFADFGVVTAK